MVLVRHRIFLLLALAAAAVLRAQTPVLTQALPAQTMLVNGAPITLDLRNYFAVPSVTGQVVQFDTSLGKFNVELLANDAPLSVQNFLSYVASATYANSFIHRIAALDGVKGNRIVQGGGYLAPAATSLARKTPVALEYKLPNARGTLALARTSELNSATSEWFFNVDDNTSVLGPSNGGGYAVFGRVLGTGMTTVDAMTAVPIYNAGGTFTNLPLRDLTAAQVAGTVPLQLANFILINSIKVASTYPTSIDLTSVIQFSVSNLAPSVATGTLSGSTLTVTPVGAGSGTISIRAGDVNNNSLSATLEITVRSSSLSLPTIVAGPVSQTVATGATVVLGVAASGEPAPTYQWRKDGVNISGATNATYYIQNATAASQGTYSVGATNSLGTAASSLAALTVISTNDPGRLINLAILAPLAVGETMTMGTVLGGAGTRGNKPLLVRAAGPALVPYGVSSYLPDPGMTLNYTSLIPTVVVAANDDWGGTSALINAFASVGAFPYSSLGSKDAALFRSGASALVSGKYTVEVSGANSGTGTVIAEIYDASGSAYTLATPRLINVSVLKQINAGTTLTAGFVIGGLTARTVLIRAIGPGLAQFGIGDHLADPTLTLNYTTPTPSVVVATNNDWAGDPAIGSAFGWVGAFPISSSTSKDAMLLITLAPGNYTAEVSPASDTAGGQAIVEIYEVP